MLWDTFKEFKNGELVLNQQPRETYKERVSLCLWVLIWNILKVKLKVIYLHNNVKFKNDPKWKAWRNKTDISMIPM